MIINIKKLKINIINQILIALSLLMRLSLRIENSFLLASIKAASAESRPFTVSDFEGMKAVEAVMTDTMNMCLVNFSLLAYSIL